MKWKMNDDFASMVCGDISRLGEQQLPHAINDYRHMIDTTNNRINSTIAFHFHFGGSLKVLESKFRSNSGERREDIGLKVRVNQLILNLFLSF